jgi:hypothetical protein
VQPERARAARVFSLTFMEKEMRFENLAIAVVAIVAASGFPTLAQIRLAQAEPLVAKPSPSPSERHDCPPGAASSAPRLSETHGRPQLERSAVAIEGCDFVDSGITVPPLGGGRTPVIPPPGTPGGDPNVVPKQ